MGTIACPGDELHRESGKGVLMATFLLLTDADGSEQFYVNADIVQFMKREEARTVIDFHGGTSYVKETPAEIMAMLERREGNVRKNGTFEEFTHLATNDGYARCGDAITMHTMPTFVTCPDCMRMMEDMPETPIW
jgi:hypothetical protein